MRTIAAGALAVLLAGCTVAVPDVGQVIDALSGRPTPSAPAPTASFDAQQTAVQQVIRRANEEQAEAFAKNDPTIMRDTSTAAHYEEMVKINGDIAASGVDAIELVNINWGAITVSGSTAQATTYETWRTTYADGSTEQSTDQNDYTLVLDGTTWLIQTNTQPGTGLQQPGATPQPGQPIANAAPVRDVSSNWSGYAATGGTYTSVTGTWKVPQPSGDTAGADATWVGIGGVNTRDLIQAGTQSMANGGSVRYEAWIEMLPATSQTVPLSVRPGDSVTATITEQSAGTWLITIKNNTTSQSYRNTVSYSSSRSSAEWIEEAPSSGRSVVPLNDFGVVTFTDGSAVKNGQTVTISGAGATAITMINGSRQPIAQPSTLGADGSSFSVARTQAPSDAGPQRRRRGP